MNLFSPAPEWRTPYETGAGNTTATYAECLAYYQKLAAAYPTEVQLREAGPTDCGQPIHEVVLGGAAATPARRPVVLIQNGIHPGEPEGIDASMMLARDLIQNKKLRPLLQQLTIVIVPVYNVDGMLNRNATTRANQNGPAEYGFRGNARHLDLNRDYVKQDSRNARTFAGLFGKWRPEVFVETHTSNGADYQYTMTLIPTQHNKLAPSLGTYLQKELLPALYAGMEHKKWPMTPYVDPIGETPESGIVNFPDLARYSTGYAALFNCIGFMPETHMLKPYPPRVQSTYDFLLTVLETVRQQTPALLAARAAADAALTQQTTFPLGWVLDDTQHETILFRGYEARHKPSEVSGLPRLYYDRTAPFTRPIKYFNTYRPAVEITAPAAYLIPQAWAEVIENLQRNGVQLRRLTTPLTGPAEVYTIDDFKTSPQPFEGHYLHSQVKLITQNSKLITAQAGDYLAVLTEQGPARRYLVEALEPQSPDSFFAWGGFDSILQQKEHFSDYVFEDLAAEVLRQQPALRQQLEAQKKTDPALAQSAEAQLDWVYQRSEYHEAGHRRYPVLRWGGAVE
ncbi:M14 family metallopeptidase [Hymenobacter sp. ASUV-10]|uniref:M14 family metallopeptidase n=1 Tax=Hymenobacter aranciens TaxID=3063996 RepID=A0ABT9BAG1_9BACT|nr:M14 family metallopeptidase [Hymenobacter sp. ASUV-10]MDO7873538.1 M14 family metallopeptidase [Hymenobacter sp. ASUV-10]